mgnify:FL=1|jgi:uncharacterized protein (TIGR03083 family)
MDHNTLLTAVEREGRALLAAAERDPSARIEHCPDWDASGLVDHIAGVWSFMAAQIEAASPDKPTGPDPDDPSTASDRLSRLVALLASVEPATPCWNWCPKEGRTASWMVRRMAHENNIHRWDAENAVGNPDPLDADLAHDGVDEILDVSWRHLPSGPVGDYPSSTLHLHRTDGDGEWLLSSAGGQLVVGHEHAKGDAAARGTASDLNLLVWGRRQPTLEVFGDEAVLDAWLALAP